MAKANIKQNRKQEMKLLRIMRNLSRSKGFIVTVALMTIRRALTHTSLGAVRTTVKLRQWSSQEGIFQNILMNFGIRGFLSGRFIPMPMH